MAKTDVLIYQDADGRVPLLDWLDGLPAKARDKCIVRVELLAETGHDLRRPHADLLEQGIYELRARLGSVNYRILYAFVGSHVVLLSHGCTKERAVPKPEINRALRNMEQFRKHPKAHTYTQGL
jgi:phage-related protein